MSAVDFQVEGVVSFAAADVLAGVQEPRAQDVRVEVRQQVDEAVEQVRTAQAGASTERLEQELARARQAVDELQAAQSGSAVSITKDARGNVVIQTPDGKTITVDPGIVPPGAIEGLVASMAPPPPPPPTFDQGPPDSVVALIGIIFACLTVMVVGLPLARAFGRRVERRAAGAVVPPDVAARLERIEQAVDAVAVEVERVSEAQRYSARLLTERLPESWPQLADAQDAARPISDRR